MKTSGLFAFIVVLAVAMAGCTSSTVVTPPNPQQSTVPVPLLSINVTGKLKYVGDVAVVTATQGSYTGPFTFTSSNDAVLALSLTAPSGAVSHAAAASAKQTLVSPNGTAYVSVVGPGSASVRVAGTDGSVATPSSLNVAKVPSAAGVVLSPSSLSFPTTGAANAKTVQVAQGAYAGTFAESDTCAKIATLSATSNASGEARYTVTPVGSGACKATFTGGQSKSATLPISVVIPPGSVTVAPKSLSFTAVGSANAKSASVAQANYTGSFTESDTCSKIATLAATSNASGAADYTVTPVGPGSCSATFTGGQDKSTNLPISVTLAPGSVQVTPTTASFTSALVSDFTNVAVSQDNYSGAFTESDTCSKIATIAAKSNAGGKASYTVKPVGPGSCAAKFAGGGGKSASLSIGVTLPAPVVAVVCAQSVDACSGSAGSTPGSVQFTAVGNTAALTPTDPKWTNAPNFTLLSDTCNKTDDPSAGGNWATLAPAVGKSAATFTLTAKGAGTSSNTANCVATFADGAGRKVRVNVEVTLGSVGVNAR
jgi:hypothetical protein